VWLKYSCSTGGFCIVDWAADFGGERKKEQSGTSQMMCDPNRGMLWDLLPKW